MLLLQATRLPAPLAIHPGPMRTAAEATTADSDPTPPADSACRILEVLSAFPHAVGHDGGAAAVK